MRQLLHELVTEEAARNMLGQHLVRTLPTGKQLSGRIVETEAYHESDPAAHSYGGRQTTRNKVMFGPAGYAYVYFTYGMHYCFNIVVRPESEAAAVLIRALEPVEGVETIHQNRFPDCHSKLVSESKNKKDMVLNLVQNDTDYYNLCSGPAKLTQALRIDRELNGHNLQQSPLQLSPGEEVSEADIITTPRIGISRATDTPWRFYIWSNPHVSKP